MKETRKNQNYGMLMGMMFGMCIGMSLGTSVLDNGGLGLSLGMCVGMCLGFFVGRAKDKEVNRQFSEKGYIVTEVIHNKDGKTFTVYIKDLQNKIQAVTVGKGEMNEEKFSVGDAVYLDEDGTLEQVYDEDDAD